MRHACASERNRVKRTTFCNMVRCAVIAQINIALTVGQEIQASTGVHFAVLTVDILEDYVISSRSVSRCVPEYDKSAPVCSRTALPRFWTAGNVA